jgi:hypothetical protein
MKALKAIALFLALSAVEPNLVERSRLALVNADINVGSLGAMRENISSVGAMRERDYFEASQSPFNAGSLDVLDKRRFAQSCR